MENEWNNEMVIENENENENGNESKRGTDKRKVRELERKALRPGDKQR